MSGPLRSKQGCWTCRLRKKKCDERRPRCSTCESLSITCYGFGPKPDWMDNGEEEKAVANSLKEIVKHTAKRKSKPQFSKQHESIIKIAPKSSDGSVEKSSSNPGPSRQHSATPPLDHGLPQEEGANMLQDGSADYASPEHLNVGPLFSISADECLLLMHFLDNVFPLQYPMYKPGVIDGGRGWLLGFLLRKKPFYHAALALSAYHRRTVVLAKLSHPCQVATLIQQEKHLEVCIELVNQSLKVSCSYNALGIAASVIQLVFFELFTANGNAWQVHLRVAMNMYHQCLEKNFENLGLAEKSRTILCDDLPLSECEPAVAQEVASFRFMAGVLLWLDIISSITAGTVPHLRLYHLRALTSNSPTKLEDVMGCENWVMLQIGRIAALYEHVTQALQQGHLACAEFQQTVVDINRDILCGLAHGGFEGFSSSEEDSASISNAMLDPHELVTHIFAYMASIYLHLVTHGFQKLEALDTTISGALRTLQTRVSRHLLPALVCPLFVIGSVARQEEEQFFRTIFSSLPLLDPSLKHRARILPILEEIWSRRRITPGFTWKDTLEFTHDILLI